MAVGKATDCLAYSQIAGRSITLMWFLCLIALALFNSRAMPSHPRGAANQHSNQRCSGATAAGPGRLCDSEHSDKQTHSCEAQRYRQQTNDERAVQLLRQRGSQGGSHHDPDG